MGVKRAIFQAAVSLVLTVVLPLLGNSVAKANGFHLMLINEDIMITVGLAITFLIFIKTYANKRLKFKGLISIFLIIIEAGYFLLFINMVSSISLPFANTNISIQYMGLVGEIPNHLLALASGLISSSNVNFPVLGDLVMLSFGLVFLRGILLIVEGRKSSQVKQKNG